MDDLQILIKAVIDESSNAAINSQLSNLAKTLSGSHDVKLRVVLDDGSVKMAQTQLQAIAKQVSSSSKSNGGSANGLQVFDISQLKADGQRYFTSVKDIVTRAQSEFGKLGKVDITNVFKSAKGDIQSFSAVVTKADGVVEKFNFNLAKIQSGSWSRRGFVQSNSVLTDKNAGANLEHTLNYLNQIGNKISDITSRTLTNTSKPLLGDMEQYNQYQTKLQQVQGRIQEIKSSTTTLSAQHKREINSMVADLQRYAKELQASAYAATDLKANTFANQKAELQAALDTNISRWKQSELFGSDFNASVQEAKAALDSALNPADLDVYRHKLTLLQEQFKQMKLVGGQEGALNSAQKLNTDIQTAQLRIQNLKQTYSSFVNDPELLSKWEELFKSSTMVSSQKELSKLNSQIRNFEQQLISAGKHSRSLWGELKNNAQKMATWMVLGGVIASVVRGVTGLYDAVLDLDKAMVELRKVTDETDEAYSSFLSNAAKKSVEIGTVYSDFVNSAADFARLGYTFEEASKLSEVANIYSVVGDQVESVDQATSSIISTMKAFDIEAENAITIVDKFNEVGNKFAISSGGIGDAMQRSAAALSEANNTIDESIALIVAANNVIQDPSVVGTMWKTVSMRIRGAKTELEEAGLETEYMAESTAKLRDSIKGLTNVDGLGGFDIMKDEDTFRSTYEIVLGISKVWEKMSDIDQAALLEILAGKRQGNALAAAIANMDDAVRAMQTSVNAEGSALAEHEKWMDSIQAKQQQLQAQYQAFANAFVSSDLVKGMFDTGTGILGWMTQLVDTVGALPALFAVITPFLGKMQFFKSTGSGMGFVPFWQTAKIDLENDIRLLEDYNRQVSVLDNTINNTQKRQSIWNDTIGKGSDNLKATVKATATATTTTESYRASTESATLSTVAFGVATKVAAVAVNIFKTALNMLFSFLIGFAISALISWIGSLIQTRKEIQELAKATIQEKDAVLENVAAFKNAYATYNKYAGQTSRTAAEEDEFRAAIDQVTKSLDGKTSALTGLTAGTEEYTEALREAAKAEHERAYIAAKQKRDAAYSDLKSRTFSSWSGSQISIDMGGRTGIEEFVKAYETAERVMARFFDEGAYGEELEPIGWDADPSNMEAVVDYYYKLIELQGELAKEENMDNDIYNQSVKITDELRESVEAYVKAKYDEAAADYEFRNGIPLTIDELKRYRSYLNDTLGKDFAFDDGNDSLKSMIDGYLGQTEVYAEFIKEITAQENAANQIREKMQAVADALVPKEFGDLEPGTSAHFRAVDEWAAKAEEVKEKLRALSEEEFNAAYDIIKESGAGSWEDLMDQVSERLLFQVPESPELTKLPDTIKTLQSNTELLASAQEEMNESGGLSAETIEKMSKATDKYLDYLYEEDGVVKLLTDDWRAFSEETMRADMDAIGDHIDKLLSRRSELEERLAGLKAGGGSSDKIAAAKKALDAINAAIAENQGLLKLYDAIFEDTAGGTALTRTLNESLGKLGALADKYEILSGAVDEYNEAGSLCVDTIQKLIDNDLLSYLEFTEQGIRLSADALDEQAEAARIAAIQALQDAASQDILALATGNVDEMSSIAKNAVKDVGNNAETAGDQAKTASGKLIEMAASLGAVISAASGGLDEGYDVDQFIADANAIAASYQGIADSIGSISITNGRSGGKKRSKSSSKAPWDDELKYYKHLRQMELMTDREYYGKLNGLLAKYSDSRKKYLDDYRSLMEEEYELARTLADDWFNDMEHRLTLMEKGGAPEQDQIAVYKQMQEEAHRLAEEARGYGLEENSDYIQELQKQWWDYQDAIEDLYSQIYQDELSAHENTLSLLESQYGMMENNRSREDMNDNLERQAAEQKAIQEAAHREAQRLRALGVDENDEAIQECVSAWWDAYSSIQDINSKIVDNILGAYDEFIDYADDFDLWSDLDFTKVDYLRQKLEALNRLWEKGVLTLEEYNSRLKELGVDIYNEQKDALTEIIEKTKELIRQETEDRIEGLEKQVDAFKEIIELKKKSLKASRDEDDYQKEVAKRVKEIAEKQAKLAQLDRDTSASANAEKAKLAEELAELQGELADYQADHSYNAQVDALDKQADAYEDSKKDEIERLKATIDTEEKLYKEAISRIDGNWESLYDDLIKWNREYGDMIDGEDSITSAWRTAKKAAEEYGSVVSALDGIKSEVYTQEETATKQAQVDSIISQMSRNGAGWHSAATQAEKDRLVQANDELAQRLSKLLGRPVLKDRGGVWHLDSTNGPRLFHTGLEQGYVGADRPGKDEVLSVLKDGELVFTRDQYMRVFNALKYGVQGVLDSLLGRLGAASPVVHEAVKSIVNNSSSTDNSKTDNGIVLQSYFYLQDVTEENMGRFAELYSTHTINKLNSASRRIGLKGSVGNSMLRG